MVGLHLASHTLYHLSSSQCAFSALYFHAANPAVKIASVSDRRPRALWPQRSYHRRRRCMACLTLFTLRYIYNITLSSLGCRRRALFCHLWGNFVIESWQLPRIVCNSVRGSGRDKTNAREIILGSNKTLVIFWIHWFCLLKTKRRCRWFDVPGWSWIWRYNQLQLADSGGVCWASGQMAKPVLKSKHFKQHLLIYWTWTSTSTPARLWYLC